MEGEGGSCSSDYLSSWGKCGGGETALSSPRGEWGAGESPDRDGTTYGENRWGRGDGSSGDRGEDSEELREEGTEEDEDEETGGGGIAELRRAAASRAGLYNPRLACSAL